jgi:hypothetical protein
MAVPDNSPSVGVERHPRDERAITPNLGTFTTAQQMGTADVRVGSNTTCTLNAMTSLGDGVADLAVRWSADANWFIFQSNLEFRQQARCSCGDVPVPYPAPLQVESTEKP